jgi:hypothetical protein
MKGRRAGARKDPQDQDLHNVPGPSLGPVREWPAEGRRELVELGAGDEVRVTEQLDLDPN